MILTYKIRHSRDFSEDLKKAFVVAEYVVQHPSCRSSKDVKHIGLKSAISNQILKKYGNQKNIKDVHSVNLIVPNQSIRVDPERQIIRVVPLQLELSYQFSGFTRVNQIEIDTTYAYVSVTVPEQPTFKPRTFIGVDRNTTGHVAVTANPETGKIEKLGKKAIHVHQKYAATRKRLQKQQKFRQVKRIKNRESRIVRDLNHKISRKIVDMAKEQQATLIFEDLGGVRKTKKQLKSFKYALHSWSFYQLQQFVEYKAKLLGVTVLYVNPAYTSQDCSRCGMRGQRRGKVFKCPVCGHVDHADVNAAFNIAIRQMSMIDRIQKEMCTMGALIPHDAMLEECRSNVRTPRL